MLISGFFGGGGGSSSAEPKPNENDKTEPAKSSGEEPKAPQQGSQEPPSATRPTQSAARPAEPATGTPTTQAAAAKAVVPTDDGRRGAAAEAIAAELRETPPTESARVEDEAATAESEARRIAEAAVEIARKGTLLDDLEGSEESTTSLLTKSVAYGEDSPYAGATSAEPGAASGGERAVDSRV